MENTIETPIIDANVSDCYASLLSLKATFPKSFYVSLFLLEFGLDINDVTEENVRLLCDALEINGNTTVISDEFINIMNNLKEIR